LIALKTEQVLSEHHLNGMDCRLVLGQLSVKVGFERIAVVLAERNRGSYV